MATIIVVDDHPAILRMMRQILRSNGLTFIGLDSGDACLATLKTLKPELIFLDIAMPTGMNGYDICRNIRQCYPALAKVPIIFLTSHNTQKSLHHAMQVGGNDYMIKPFQPEAVLRRVKRWLPRHSHY